MARCVHGFERSAVPCVACGDSSRKAPAPRRERYRKRTDPDEPKRVRPAHPSFQDLTGRPFYGARVLERAPNDRDGSAVWRVALPCGHVRTIKGIAIRAAAGAFRCLEKGCK